MTIVDRHAVLLRKTTRLLVSATGEGSQRPEGGRVYQLRKGEENGSAGCDDWLGRRVSHSTREPNAEAGARVRRTAQRCKEPSGEFGRGREPMRGAVRVGSPATEVYGCNMRANRAACSYRDRACRRSGCERQHARS